MNKHIANRQLLLLSIVLVTMALSACSSKPVMQEPISARPTVVTSLKRYAKKMVLVPGDQLEINVYRNTEISRTVMIRPDGYISLPLLDDVKAAGLTLQELDDTITNRLKGRLKNPEVAIIHVNPLEPMVFVYGDVGQTKPVPLRQAKTLALALAYAGGVVRTGAIGDVALIRLEDDGYIRMHLLDDEQSGLAGQYMAYQNVALKPDDLIIIHENNRSVAHRFIADFLIQPLQAFNLMWTPYYQHRYNPEVISN